VIALSALLVLGPLLAVAAAAIRLTSRGPILFSQYRLGLDGATFRIYKFRTFEVDECDPSGRSQTVANDPRVMPIGRFLRRTSIDELPQLLNVLKGDMSIVGPRPHVAGQYAAGMAYDELVPYYFRRNAVRPGITGWAQVNGFRGPTTDEAMARGRVDHDIAYIQNFSIALDLWIIVLTIWREFVTGRGV
jgi:lipopolysaccharide/colanic/teichoic acid biosynthesis glycosyltransferase